MNSLLFILLWCFVFFMDTEMANGLTRIKRADQEKRSKIPEEFVVVNPRSSISNQDNKEVRGAGSDHLEKHDKSKEMDTMYDKVMETFNATKERAKAKDKANQFKTEQELTNKTPALKNNKHSPLVAPLTTYILREQDHKMGDHFSNPQKTTNEIVVIDNNPKEECNILEGEKHLTSRDYNEGNFMAHFVPAEHTVTGAAHVIIPPNRLPVSRPFSPLEQMFRLANMFLYNVARDPIPIHTQSASLTLMPLNSMAQAEILAEEPETLDYYYNGIESPSFSSHHPLIMAPSAGSSAPVSDQSHTVFYGPPLVFKQPVSANEPKNVLNLIENALDSLMAGTGNEGDTENEIELHCPIHHEKKSVISADSSEHNPESEDGGVIQVCSCRLIKKAKKDTKKQLENAHLDGRPLFHTAMI